MRKLRVTDYELLVTVLCLLLPLALAEAAAPVAADLSCKVIKDTSNSTLNIITLRATDADGDLLSFSIASGQDLPSNGKLYSLTSEGVADTEITEGVLPYTIRANKLKYVSNEGFQGQDFFTYTVTDETGRSSTALVTVNVVPWFAPIGIPEPEFGITETHYMYQGQLFDYDQDGVPEAAYKDAGNGPYTHYIDNQHAQATDTNNPYGTPEHPRLTIPASLPAGSVVEVRNGPYNYGPGYIPISGQGTAANPIFIRGVPGEEPEFEAQFAVTSGQYVIAENLLLRKAGISHADHIVLRKSTIDGDTTAGTGVQVCYSNTITVYDCLIANHGDWLAPGDNDYHGVKTVGRLATPLYDVWFTDCEMRFNDGNGIQISDYYADPATMNDTNHHIYAGRNEVHHNRQTGLWSKVARDIIFSQNRVHGTRRDNDQGGLGCQLGPANVWFIYNEIFDCDVGIYCPSGAASDVYVIGNVIHDIHPVSFDPNNPWSMSALTLAGGGLHKWIVNNTIHDVVAGINGAGMSGSYNIVNNIISDVDVSRGGNHVFLVTSGVIEGRLNNNVFWENGDPARIRVGGTYDVDAFEAAFAGTGNANTDPLFVDAAGDDFHFQTIAAGYLEDSPALDTGIEHEVYSLFEALYATETFDANIRLDFAGTPRPQDSAPDIGAYEYVPSAPGVPGDLSGDSQVNILDLQACVNHILGTADYGTRTDVNEDGSVNVLDIQRIVNIILE